MTTDHLTEDQLAALDVARTTAVALHARVAAGSDDDAARALIRTAGAAVDALVVAIPALADTHAGWMGRWGATTRQPADRRALAVVGPPGRPH